MNNKNQINLLKRSKSVCSLNEYIGIKGAGFVDYQRYSRSVSESLENPGHDLESETWEKHDDGIGEEIGVLEQKIDKLSGEYCYIFLLSFLSLLFFNVCI